MESIDTIEELEEEMKGAILIILDAMGYDADTFLQWCCDVCNEHAAPQGTLQ